MYKSLFSAIGIISCASAIIAAEPVKFLGRRDYIGYEPAVVTDINGDGVPDIVGLGAYGHTFYPYIGNGDGTFRRLPEQSNGWDPVVSGTAQDLNGDGFADLIIAGSTSPINKGWLPDRCTNGQTFQNFSGYFTVRHGADVEETINRVKTRDISVVQAKKHQPVILFLLEQVPASTPFQAAPLFLGIMAAEKENQEARVAVVEVRQVDIEVWAGELRPVPFVPSVVMRAILLLLNSVNHSAPSGPAVIPLGPIIILLTA